MRASRATCDFVVAPLPSPPMTYPISLIFRGHSLNSGYGFHPFCPGAFPSVMKLRTGTYAAVSRLSRRNSRRRRRRELSCVHWPGASCGAGEHGPKTRKTRSPGTLRVVSFCAVQTKLVDRIRFLCHAVLSTQCRPLSTYALSCYPQATSRI